MAIQFRRTRMRSWTSTCGDSNKDLSEPIRTECADNRDSGPMAGNPSCKAASHTIQIE